MEYFIWIFGVKGRDCMPVCQARLELFLKAHFSQSSTQHNWRDKVAAVSQVAHRAERAVSAEHPVHLRLSHAGLLEQGTQPQVSLTNRAVPVRFAHDDRQRFGGGRFDRLFDSVVQGCLCRSISAVRPRQTMRSGRRRWTCSTTWLLPSSAEAPFPYPTSGW